MTAYLTDTTDPDDLEQGFQEGIYTAAKLYPANATTNSAAGVTDLAQIEMSEPNGVHRRPLLIHGEVTDAEIDVFDQEAVFIERHLKSLRTGR